VRSNNGGKTTTDGPQARHQVRAFAEEDGEESARGERGKKARSKRAERVRSESEMTTNLDTPASEHSTVDKRTHQPPPRFQFSIATLLLITTATAVVCALVFQIPSNISLPAMVFLSVAVFPAMWTTMIVFGRGYQRAFGIGAMFPAIILVFFGVIMIGESNVLSSSGPRFDRSSDDYFILRLVLLLCWTSDVVVGLVCMAVRWALVKRHQR
jgi:hypothetical protein